MMSKIVDMLFLSSKKISINVCARITRHHIFANTNIGNAIIMPGHMSTEIDITFRYQYPNEIPEIFSHLRSPMFKL